MINIIFNNDSSFCFLDNFVKFASFFLLILFETTYFGSV